MRNALLVGVVSVGLGAVLLEAGVNTAGMMIIVFFVGALFGEILNRDVE